MTRNSTLPALFLLAACDISWRPARNDNSTPPLKCPSGEVEWSCSFALPVVSPPHRTSKLICADSDATARERMKRAFPSACDMTCTPTGAGANNDTQGAEDGEPDACDEPPPVPVCADPGVTCGLPGEAPCCSGVCSLSVCE